MRRIRIIINSYILNFILPSMQYQAIFQINHIIGLIKVITSPYPLIQQSYNFKQYQFSFNTNDMPLRYFQVLIMIVSLSQIMWKAKRIARTVSYSFSTENLKLKNQYQRLWAICRPELKKYAYCSVIALLHAGTFMYLPNIYEDINTLMALKISEVPKDILLQAYVIKIGKWAGIFGALGTLTYLRRYQFLDVSNRISVRFRTVLYSHILNQDFYRRNQFAQACVHHLVTDVKSLSQFTGETVFMGVRGVFFLLGGIGCLLYYSPYLSIISIGIMSVFNLLFRSRNTLLKHLKSEENKALIKITQFVGEKFHSLRLIKISNTEYFEKYKFAQELKSFYDYSKLVSKANGINYGFLEGLGLFSLFSVAACGAMLISYEITNFSLIATSTYALYVALGFRSLISFNTELMKMMAIYSTVEAKVGPIHNHPLYKHAFLEESLKQYEQKIKELEQQRYKVQSKGVKIRIQNLHFTYTNEKGDKVGKIYDNYSLTITPGSIVALVGPSGSGKSTLFNLLTKLEQTEQGSIFYDDQNIQDMTFQDIQRMVSYVTQQNYLFKGTFRDNLKYGNQHFDCSDQKLNQCLKLTNAFDFVNSKGGLDALIAQKGSNLSGGQKQRIILARALIKHPRLLLLDEGTSGIDPFSQRIIINNLAKIRSEMTTILITHKIEPFEPILTQVIKLRE